MSSVSTAGVQVRTNKGHMLGLGDIIDNGYEGEGIAKIDNFTIFVPNSIKGEKLKIVIVKVTSSYAYGKILEIIENFRKSNSA